MNLCLHLIMSLMAVYQLVFKVRPGVPVIPTCDKNFSVLKCWILQHVLKKLRNTEMRSKEKHTNNRKTYEQSFSNKCKN